MTALMLDQPALEATSVFWLRIMSGFFEITESELTIGQSVAASSKMFSPPARLIKSLMKVPVPPP
jgi:hypothetical protein